MSEAIQREIDFSINAFEYLKENEQYLSKLSREKLDSKIKSYNLPEDRKTGIDDYFKTTNKDRLSEIYINNNNKQFDYSYNLFSKNKGKGFDKYFIDLKTRAQNGEFRERGKALDEVLFELSSFKYLTKIFGETSHLALQLFCKVFAVLNIIETVNPDLLVLCSAVKKTYYPEYARVISLANEKNIDMVERSLSLFELAEKDYFNLFFREEILFSNAFIENFAEFLEEDNQRQAWPIGKYETLMLCMLNMGGEFNDDYLSLYEKYKPLDINNAYLRIALLAQYLSKKSKMKITFKHINRDKLVDYNKPYYDDLKAAIESGDSTNYKTYKISTKIIELLTTQSYEVANEYIKEVSDGYLGKFLIKETIKKILERNEMSVNKARFILDYSPNTLYSYVSRAKKFTDSKVDVYKFTIELLRVNRFKESAEVARQLVELMQSDNSISDELLETIYMQMKLTLEIEGFRFIKK